MADYFIKDRHKSNTSKSNQIRLLVAVAFLIFGGVALWFVFTDFYLSEEWEGYIISESPLGYFLLSSLISLGPELAGIAIGVIIIDWLNERRQNRELQQQLLRQVTSRHNDVADTAINELAYHGWLVDGSMKNARLLHATLQNSNLYKANLDGSYIIDTDLKYAVLNEASLNNTHILGTNFEGAGLQDARLCDAYLKIVSFKGSNLRDADFSGAKLEAVNFTDADMSHVDMEGAVLIFPMVKNTILFEANLPHLNLTRIDFRGCLLEGANLTGSDLRHANLSDLSLTETNLSYALLQNANLEKADLEQAILKGANLTNANVSIKQLSLAFLSHETIMPNGINFDPSDYSDLAWNGYDYNNEPEDKSSYSPGLAHIHIIRMTSRLKSRRMAYAIWRSHKILQNIASKLESDSLMVIITRVYVRLLTYLLGKDT